MRGGWLSVLKDAAAEVRRAIKSLIGSRESGEVVGLGAGGGFSKYIDIVAERAVVEYLDRSSIPCVLVSEESGVKRIGEGEPEVYLILDSVDGTTNAVRGINFISTSIAASPSDKFNDIEAAVVMRLDDGGVYTAEKGGGAKYNDADIQPSDVRVLNKAVISVELSRSPGNIDRVVPILKEAKSVRSLGSGALEICHVASGQLDAYVDVRRMIRTTDIAAATLIIKEASGVILKPNGEPLDNVQLTRLERFSLIAAANTELFNQIASLLR